MWMRPTQSACQAGLLVPWSYSLRASVTMLAIMFAGKTYSTLELDKIISDIFSLEKGGSASKTILPEGDVCRLCDMAKEILQREDNVKAVQTPVMVVGDGALSTFDFLSRHRRCVWSGQRSLSLLQDLSGQPRWGGVSAWCWRWQALGMSGSPDGTPASELGSMDHGRA